MNSKFHLIYFIGLTFSNFVLSDVIDIGIINGFWSSEISASESCLNSDVCNPCVSDVISKIETLNRMGIGKFTVWPRDAPDQKPSDEGTHWQGIQRIRNSNLIGITTNANHVAQLSIARIGSISDSDSEVGSVPGSPNVNEIVSTTILDGNFKHAGGFQSIGDVVVICVDDRRAGEFGSRVLFFEIKDNGELEPLKTAINRDRGTAAGTVGIVKLKSNRYLVSVGGYSGGGEVDFYLSRTINLKNTQFVKLGSWTSSGSGVEWPRDVVPSNSFQTFNLIKQCNGDLFGIGTRAEYALFDDELFLYKLDLRLPSKPLFTLISRKQLDCSANTNENYCDFSAAAAPFVTEDNNIRVYGVEHDEDGPGGTIKFAEFPQTFGQSTGAVDKNNDEINSKDKTVLK